MIFSTSCKHTQNTHVAGVAKGIDACIMETMPGVVHDLPKLECGSRHGVLFISLFAAGSMAQAMRASTDQHSTAAGL